MAAARHPHPHAHVHDDEESKDSVSESSQYEERFFTKIPYLPSRVLGGSQSSNASSKSSASGEPILLQTLEAIAYEDHEALPPAPLAASTINNIVPFRGASSSRREQNREETYSQISELTQSIALRTMEGSQVRVADDVVQHFAFKSADRGVDEASNMDQRALRNLEQKVRFFLARNRAYERAVKLTQLIADDEEKDQVDQSKIIEWSLGLSVLVSLLCFLPMCTIPLQEQKAIFANTPLRTSVRANQFVESLYFAVGSAAPLFMELAIMSLYSTFNFKGLNPQSWASDAISKIGFTRLVFCLTIMIPAIVQVGVVFAGDTVVLPESTFVCFTFWQFCMFSAAGVHFFLKYTPSVMSREYMLLMLSVFILGNLIQPWATISTNFSAIYNYGLFFQCASATMYLYYLYTLGRQVWAGKLSTVDGVLSPIAYGVIGINRGYMTVLLLDYSVLPTSMNIDSKTLTVFLASWHVYVKCFMVVLLNSLPLNLAKRDIDRAMSSLNELLNVSAVEDKIGGDSGMSGHIPLDVIVQSNEDTSVGGVDEAENGEGGVEHGRAGAGAVSNEEEMGLNEDAGGAGSVLQELTADRARLLSLSAKSTYSPPRRSSLDLELGRTSPGTSKANSRSRLLGTKR